VLFLGGITKASYSDSVDEFVIKARIRNLHPPRDKEDSRHLFAKLSITRTPFAPLAAMVWIALGQGRTTPGQCCLKVSWPFFRITGSRVSPAFSKRLLPRGGLFNEKSRWRICLVRSVITWRN